MSAPDTWSRFRALTPARVALGRSGDSLATSAQLAFQLAHARARDAVRHEADLARVAADLARNGIVSLEVHSSAGDRDQYLLRPDLGRQLDVAGRERLGRAAAEPVDLVIVIADGLSGFAVEHHAAALVAGLHPRLSPPGWRLAPVVLVRQGRVAVGDGIGAALRARLALVLIGERPGLSSPDSLGAYLTWDPRPGRTDAERNCVSNIRPEGLPLARATDKLDWLIHQARRLERTGVGLKEESGMGGFRDLGIGGLRDSGTPGTGESRSDLNVT